MVANPKTETLYGSDYYLWLEKSAELLREGRLSDLDIPNLIEEIEGMVRSEKNALKSNLRVVLMHLLKYKYEPQRRSNSWLYTLREHRTRITDALEDSPSFKRYLSEVFAQCYQVARQEAADETGLPLDTFPEQSPFSREQALDPNYLPEEEETMDSTDQ